MTTAITPQRRMTSDMACTLLVFLDDEQRKWNRGELARRTRCSPPTMHLILKHLEFAGWLARGIAEPPIGTQMCFHLTKEGATNARIALKHNYGRDPGILLLACAVHVSSAVVTSILRA